MTTAEKQHLFRMFLHQTWFNLSDEGMEDAIYTRYAMKTFTGVDWGSEEQAAEATTLFLAQSPI